MRDGYWMGGWDGCLHILDRGVGGRLWGFGWFCDRPVLLRATPSPCFARLVLVARLKLHPVLGFAFFFSSTHYQASFSWALFSLFPFALWLQESRHRTRDGDGFWLDGSDSRRHPFTGGFHGVLISSGHTIPSWHRHLSGTFPITCYLA